MKAWAVQAAILIGSVAGAAAAPSLSAFEIITPAVDVSTAPQAVEVELSLLAPDGFFDGLLTFESAGGEEFLVPFDIGDLAAGDAMSGDYEIGFQFPQFAPPGNWEVRLQLQDQLGGLSFYGAGVTAFPPGSDTTLEVANSGAVDRSGPTLVAWTAPSSAVAVSPSTTTDLQFGMRFADDGVGFWVGFLRVYAWNGQWVGAGVIEPSLSWEGPASDYDVTVTLPPGFPTGPLTLTLILEDHFGHRRTYNSSPFFSGGNSELFPPGADRLLAAFPAGSAVDDAAPQVDDAQLSAASVEVTGQARSVELEIDYTDLTSPPAAAVGLRDARFTLVGPGGEQLTIPSSFQRTSGTAAAGVISATLTVPAYAAPGMWSGYVEVWDWNGNNRIYGASPAEAPDAGWAIDLEVINAGPVDTTPPQLLSAGFGAALLNITNGPGEFSLFLEVAEDASGLKEARVQMSGDGDPALDFELELGSSDLVDGGLRRGVYRGAVPVPAFADTQTVTIWRVTLTDVAGNVAVYQGPAVPAGVFDELTVQNFGTVDLGAPSLLAFELSQDSVDVTGGAVTISAHVEVGDDASGFTDGRLVFGPYQHLFDLSHLTSGQATSGELDFLIELPPFSSPGTHDIYVVLSDALENTAIYSGVFGFPLPPGADSTLQIINGAGVDVTPPELLAVGLAAPTVDVALGETVDLTLSARDLGCGNVSGVMRIAGFEAPLGAAQLIGGTSADGTYSVALPLPASLAPGVYSIRLQLSDWLGNAEDFGAGDSPYPGGFAGTVTVVNSAPPGADEIEVVEVFPVGADPAIAFLTTLGVDYEIESAPTPEGPWSPYAGPLEGTGSVLVIQGRSDPREERRFYQIISSTPE